MGWIRVLLAMAVVATHAGVDFAVGGQLAVQLFYMISGFLISFILVERKSYDSAGRFYLSRYLRLYPAYLVVALLAAIAHRVANPAWYAKFGELPADALALLGIANATLFLQDTVMFTGVQDGRLVPVTNFLDSDVALFTGLLVPQAWTLSIELMFYMIAPFVLRSRVAIFSLLAASLAVRAWLLAIGLGTKDPWSYRFFPAELALFLLGALSHQLLGGWARSIDRPALRNGVFAATVVVLVAWSSLPATGGLADTALFLAFALALPFLFSFQNASPIDQRIGDLSYPLYISHMLTLNLAKFALTKLGLYGSALGLAVSLTLPLFVAYALDRLVIEPLESWRRGLRRSA